MSIWRSKQSRHLARMRTAVSCASMLTGTFAGLLTGCSLNGVVEAKPPATVVGRDIAKTEEGAIAFVRSALTQFAIVFNGTAQTYPAASYVIASGVFTDEFQYLAYNLGPEFDLRKSEGAADFATTRDALYSNLQYARVTSQIARQAMAAHTKGSSSFYRGMATITEAYAIIHLAEMFCSGIPLSEVSLDNDIQYRPGSPTNALFDHAILLLDSAIAIQTDSANMRHLARVAKGRALLGLGKYAEAAAAVKDVPDGFRYSTEHSALIPGLANTMGRTFANPLVHVSDGEGGNGIHWSAANDPRLKLGSLFGVSYKPDMYPTSGTPTPLASAIEARLIQAEAALFANDASWLTILNALRTDGTYYIVPPDTVWGLGTGVIEGQTRGLRPLRDPGSPDARIDLVFQERAFWLFATGHRQGDLRRLVRVYRRPQSQVYPTGEYTNALGSIVTGGTYGDIIALPASTRERLANPLYTGCLNLNQ